MADTDRTLSALGALIAFGATAYGLVLLQTRPGVGTTDVFPLLFLAAPGIVLAGRALGRVGPER